MKINTTKAFTRSTTFANKLKESLSSDNNITGKFIIYYMQIVLL